MTEEEVIAYLLAHRTTLTFIDGDVGDSRARFSE
jgi:hypothetical protein